MKVVVLYRPQSEHSRIVEDFLRDFDRRYSREVAIETVDLNTREGSSMASLYDIVQYPGILVVNSFGSVIHSWQGVELPLMSEVAASVA